MESLLRTRVGSFTLDQSIRLDEAEEIMKSDEPDRIRDYIMPVDSFFGDAPRATVKQEGLKALLNGNTVKRSLTDLPRGKEKRDVRMYGPDGQFCALYSYDPVRDELKNVKMFPAGSR